MPKYTDVFPKHGSIRPAARKRGQIFPEKLNTFFANISLCAIPYHAAAIQGGMYMLKKFLAFLTTLAMVFAFVGCSGGESPETAVTNYLTAFQSLDLETINKYTNDTSETTETADDAISDLENEETGKAFVENLTFEILSSTEEEDTATVKVSITNVDMANAMSQAISEMIPLAFAGLSEEELEQKSTEAMISAIANNKDTTYTKEVDISLVKGENNWLIVPDNDLADAITGGLVSYAENINEAFS